MNYFSMPSNIFCARGDVFEGRTGFGCVNDSFEPEYVTVSGKIEQTASYYPYGEPWLEPEGDNRRIYGGKERLNIGGMRHSDYGSRLLDTRAGRWTTQDPHQEYYFNLSPYNVCGADPINYVDKDGRDITLITAGMHIAMLIGNDNDGWRYYSMNGVPTYWLSIGKLGGCFRHNLGTEVFSSVEDFLDSEFNNSGTLTEELSGVKCGYSYSESYTVVCDEEQDRTAMQSFINTADDGYDLLNNNCADAVFNAVSAAGFEVPLGDYYYYEVGIETAKSLQQSCRPLRVIGKFQENFVRFIDKRKMAIPTVLFNNFRRKYPNGYYRTNNTR